MVANTLVTLLPSQRVVWGHAQPIVVQGSPHLLTCAHLVMGATRMAYRGTQIGFKIQCVDSTSDLAIIAWHVIGPQQYVNIAPPDYSVGPPTNRIADAPGDCGEAVANGDLVGLINSMYVPMRRNAVWRFVTSYTRYGMIMPHVRIPRIADFQLLSIDSLPVPSAYVYLGCKFPGDEITAVFKHASGFNRVETIILRA